MERIGNKEFADEIVEKAKQLGACLAGIADVLKLRRSPSHVIYSKLDSFRGIGTKESKGIAPGEFAWPQRARSIIVLAVPHPSYEPELDWWIEGCHGGTPGNQMLISINDGLSRWLKEKKGVKTKKLPYYIEQGGVFLKDAAAMAGLGCIGKNNLFLTPDFGPEIRLRALFTYLELPSTGPLEFDPCKECEMPCRKVCPQDAFASKKYLQGQMGLADLPGKDGVYDRHLCNAQMEFDVAESERTAAEGGEKARRVVRYCTA
jgi:epoxyqueuosine reductase